MVLEHLVEEVLALAGPRTPVPIQVMEVEVGTGQLGREIISLDISEYGDPLHTRHIRVPFSAYLKAHRRKEYFGEHVVAGMPPLFQIPLCGVDEEEALEIMRRSDEVAALAGDVRMTIPDATDAMSNLIAEYQKAPLAAFHQQYFEDEILAPGVSKALRQRSRSALPLCVENALQNPNDLLLKPAVVQHVVRVLLALGWRPRQIAGLIWTAFKQDHNWGSRWGRSDPCWRADFFTRVFAGLVATGRDSLIDLNCVSHQEKGYCAYSGCTNNLLTYQHLLLARRAHG
jgi:hypothetical protein